MYRGGTPMTATSLAPMWTVYHPNISGGCPGMAKMGSSATMSTRPSSRSITPSSTPVRGGTMTLASGFPSRARMKDSKVSRSIFPIFLLPAAMVPPRDLAGLPRHLNWISSHEDRDRLLSHGACLVEDLRHLPAGRPHRLGHLPGHGGSFRLFYLLGLAAPVDDRVDPSPLPAVGLQPFREVRSPGKIDPRPDRGVHLPELDDQACHVAGGPELHPARRSRPALHDRDPAVDGEHVIPGLCEGPRVHEVRPHLGDQSGELPASLDLPERDHHPPEHPESFLVHRLTCPGLSARA